MVVSHAPELRHIVVKGLKQLVIVIGDISTRIRKSNKLETTVAQRVKFGKALLGSV
ncbi:MAG: hypothetical protein SPM31_06365 [Prevotella sp.]|nr:hypothetical protein [Prevotella sp.]